MSDKKLFVVTITYQAYAYAESSDEAEDCKGDVVDWEKPSITAMPVTGNPLGWDTNCLVYHQGSGDIYLRDVLPGGSRP